MAWVAFVVIGSQSIVIDSSAGLQADAAHLGDIILRWWVS